MSWQRCCVCLLGLLVLIAEGRSDESAIKDAPPVVRRVDVSGPKTLDRRQQQILVGTLYRGLPTELRIALPAAELPAPGTFELVKTCSCFSAQLVTAGPIEGSGRQENDWAGLSVVVVPANQNLSEKIYVYRKVDAQGGEAVSREPKDALFEFEIRGVVKPLVTVEFSPNQVPWGDEKTTVTVRGSESRFLIEQSSIQIDIPELKVEGPEIEPNGSVQFTVSRLPQLEKIPEVGDDDRESFAIRVICQVKILEEEITTLPFEGSYRLWASNSVRMVPNRILLERDELKSNVWLSIVELSGETLDDGDFPYRLIRVLPGGGIREIELLPENIQRISETRWRVGFLPPSMSHEDESVAIFLHRKFGVKTGSDSLAKTVIRLTGP
jgi:hypothetical protein